MGSKGNTISSLYPKQPVCLVYYKGVGEHDYKEELCYPHKSFIKAMKQLVREWGEEVAFRVLDEYDGMIFWIYDDIGYKFVKDHECTAPITAETIEFNRRYYGG